ncbi:LysM domain-containing protein [Leifsonia sp. 22587]|uniref:LysM domain-containing protein n=1 Tax=Leifsonia sp. 22587 TaxID=3453946 RepID=UPI003F877A17
MVHIRAFRRLMLGTVATAALVAATAGLSGCALFGGDAKAVSAPHRTPHASGTATTSPRSTPGVGILTGSPTPTATPTAPPPPAPTLTQVPAGTVVAQGSVASPKGSIHYRYRVVSTGDGMYSVEYSGFTSTVPVPVSATFLETPPSVGDGLTYHGIGDHALGGPTTAAAPQTSAVLGKKPSYLTTLVTYSSVASEDGVPVELGPNKVLAVNTVSWSIPPRQSNVHPVDGGPLVGARGAVTETTASGAPARYVVAVGDTTEKVAQRFGIPVSYLVWLNADRQVFDAQQQLYSSVTLNLNPDDL